MPSDWFLSCQEEDYDVPEVDQMTSFPCSATLICIPPHLHAQWKNEINKFVGKKCKVGKGMNLGFFVV